jgi:hypothetical protein
MDGLGLVNAVGLLLPEKMRHDAEERFESKNIY